MPRSSGRASAARRATLAVTVVACAMTAVVPISAASGPSGGAPADAAQSPAPRSVHVRGRFIPIDDVGTYRVTGDLMGTWYTLTAHTYYQSDAMIIQKGLERFEGCLDLNRNRHCDRGRKGQFRTDYIYWASFDPRTGRLIKGECIHPVTSGKGSFAGLRGLLNVHDKTVGNTVVSTYQGDLVLNAVSEHHADIGETAAPAPDAAAVANC